MTQFTVLLPHRRNPANDNALSIAIDCLMKNTKADFRILMDCAYDKPLYPRLNRLVKQAPTDTCVYLASDMFVAPNWDVQMLATFRKDLFVTGVVVEPGAIALYHLNLHHDFGRKPETFRRAEFEQWTVADAPVPSGEGWPCGYAFSRKRVLDLGGFEEHRVTDNHGFTDADMMLWERHKAMGGRIVRVRSFCYHLQRFSEPSEQTDEKRNL